MVQRRSIERDVTIRGCSDGAVKERKSVGDELRCYEMERF